MSLRFSIVALLALAPGGLHALQAVREPERPRLAARADTNDWEAYYDFGAQALRERPAQADRAFYWAGRLNPTRAEPPFGRWVAFWLRTNKDWIAYRDGLTKPRDQAEVRQAEAWRRDALQRNPFVHQAIEALIWEELVPGRWRSDPGTRAFLAHAEGRLADAADEYARAIRGNPGRYAWLRFSRAVVLVGLQRYDSAEAELARLIEYERRTVEERLLPQYQSIELLEYATALLFMVRGDRRRARDALDRALLENLGFAPAHQMLGQLALNSNDVSSALREYLLAIELRDDDAVLRLEYGRALTRARRGDEALDQLRAAIRLEPHWAEPYLELGMVLDATADTAATRAAYQAFLARAPAGARARIAQAEARLKALGAAETPR